jgi:hypothetical protein
MRNLMFFVSCSVFAVLVAGAGCESSTRPRSTGSAGSGSAGSGSAGSGSAGSAAGENGSAGAAAGDTGSAGSGSAGAAAGAGDAGSGTAGSGTAGSGTAGSGTAGSGTAGSGTAGTGAAGDGAAGAAAVACDLSAVVTAGGSASKCPAMTAWTATAMPDGTANPFNLAETIRLPKYAIDGSMTTRYSSGSAGVGTEYFQVDLGSMVNVSGITTYTKDATDGAAAYKVELSTDGTNWTTVATCALSASANNQVINFASKPARYIKFDQTGTIYDPAAGATHWWSIWEFGVVCN